MNTTDRWLLPEGIEELLPPQARRLETLRRRLLDIYATWGYAQVMPPFIEYLESLLVGSGHDLDLETFKLTDQLTGRLMGVRTDMTGGTHRCPPLAVRSADPALLPGHGVAYPSWRSGRLAQPVAGRGRALWPCRH